MTFFFFNFFSYPCCNYKSLGYIVSLQKKLKKISQFQHILSVLSTLINRTNSFRFFFLYFFVKYLHFDSLALHFLIFFSIRAILFHTAYIICCWLIYIFSHLLDKHKNCFSTVFVYMCVFIIILVLSLVLFNRCFFALSFSVVFNFDDFKCFQIVVVVVGFLLFLRNEIDNFSFFQSAKHYKKN